AGTVKIPYPSESRPWNAITPVGSSLLRRTPGHAKRATAARAKAAPRDRRILRVVMDARFVPDAQERGSVRRIPVLIPQESRGAHSNRLVDGGRRAPSFGHSGHAVP